MTCRHHEVFFNFKDFGLTSSKEEAEPIFRAASQEKFLLPQQSLPVRGAAYANTEAKSRTDAARCKGNKLRKRKSAPKRLSLFSAGLTLFKVVMMIERSGHDARKEQRGGSKTERREGRYREIKADGKGEGGERKR